MRIPPGSFAEVVEAVDRLPPEEQAELLEIIRSRLHNWEERRLLKRVLQAEAEYRAGLATPTTVEELRRGLAE